MWSMWQRNHPKTRRRRLALAALAGFASLVPLAMPVAGQGQGEGWSRVDSANFQVFAQMEEPAARRIATELETLHATLAGWMGELGVESTLPNLVYAFADDAAFAPYKAGVNRDPTRVAGFFVAHPHGNYMAFDAASPAGLSRVVYHEYLHHFARHHLPGIPLWFNEGLAELYGSFRVEGGQVVLGAVHQDRLHWLRTEPLLPLAELFAVGSDSELYHGGEERGTFYAQSWALVHCLMVANPGRGAQLVDFLARLGGGEEVERAFEAAFGLGFAALERELAAYVARPEWPELRVEVAKLGNVAPVKGGPMPRAETQARLGDLLLHSAPEAGAEARRHFDAALALDPTLGFAFAGLGQVEAQVGSHDEAEAWFETAIALDPGDGRSWFLLGRARLERLGREATRETWGAEALRALADQTIAAFEKSLVLAPDFPPALALLGMAWTYHPQPAQRGLEALARASRWLGERRELLFHRAVLEARLGRVAAAERTVERLAAHADATPEWLETARLAIAGAAPGTREQEP